MSSYRKTMGEVYNGMYLVEGNIDKIKDIVSKKKATKIDGVMVDLFTASAISQVYDKAGSSTKKQMEILPITKLASVVMKMMGSITNPRKMKNDYVPEELDLDEGSWHIAKNMNALKKKMQKPIPKNDLMVKFVMKHIGDDELADEMFDAKTGTDMVPMIKSAMKRLNIKEEVELDEVFDFVLLDKDNKIAGRYSGSNAKKEAESGKKSAHLPPMSIPKGDVKKMKIVPISPKDKKGIGDTVLAIGEKLDKDDEIIVKKVVDKLKKASQAHAGQSKDLQKAIDEDGHTDVASAQNNVKVATAALTKMSGELAKLSPEDALPSWWTNKVAVAVDKLDGMADYLDTQVEEVDEDYVLTVKDKEVNRYKSEKDARKAFHDLVKQHGHRNVKVFKEETDLDEAILKPGMTMKVIYKGKKVQGKVVRRDKGEKGGSPFYVVDVGGIESIKVPDRINSGYNEEADLDEASARGDAKRSMRRDRDFGRKDDLDKDDAASDDDVKAASKNIMMQLRKAANLRGTFAVEFGDKKKVKVDPKVAQAAASKYNSLRRPADKEKFQSQIAKSYKDMLKAIKEAVSPAQQAAIAISKKERGEKPKKESKFSTINKQLKGEK